MDLPETSEVSTAIDNQPAAPIGESSRRDDIMKAMDAKEKTELAETPEQKSVRERDDKGKFTAKVDKPLETTDKPIEAKPVRAYPKSWTRGLESKYDTLDPDVVSQIEKRESDMENGFKRIEQIKQFHDEINQVILPYMPTLNSLGKKPSEAIKELLNADYTLRNAAPNQKKDYFNRLAKNYGIDLGTVSTVQSEPLAQLQDKIYQLETQLHQNQQASQQQSQTAAFAPYINEVNQFASDPAHSHYETVRPIMAALIESGAAVDLQSAYDQALWTRPDLRDQQLSEQRKTWQEEEKERVNKAKQAAVSVKGAPSSSQPSNQPHDRRAAIEAAMNARSR